MAFRLDATSISRLELGASTGTGTASTALIHPPSTILLGNKPLSAAVTLPVSEQQHQSGTLDPPTPEPHPSSALSGGVQPLHSTVDSCTHTRTLENYPLKS